MKIKSIRGVKDILPGEIEKWQWVESVMHRLFAVYGFKEIRPPIFEYTPLFQRSIGETTDIVEKEMYTFEDRGGDSITLRPEGTASVVRAYIEHKLHAQNPLLKLYYLGPMFRYERPQAGRFRQFYQIGVEAMGSPHPGVDAEVITLLWDFFQELGLQGLELHVSSLGCEKCRPGYREKLKAAVKPHLAELCENCNKRYEKNPLRVLDCKVERDQEIAKDLPKIQNHLCEDCQENLFDVLAHLGSMGTKVNTYRHLVRGLDYYNRVVFEVTSEEGLGSQNAVCGGGRYDTLVEQLGGPATPCFGFAIGMERLISLIPEEKIQQLGQKTDLFVIMLGKDALQHGYLWIHEYRKKNLAVNHENGEGSMKSQMRKANKLNSRFVLIIGDNEIQTGRYLLKNMQEGGQIEVEPASVPQKIESILDESHPNR